MFIADQKLTGYQLYLVSAFFAFILTFVFEQFFMLFSFVHYPSVKQFMLYFYFIIFISYLLFVNINFSKRGLTSIQSFFTGIILTVISLLVHLLNNFVRNFVQGHQGGEPFRIEFFGVFFLFVLVGGAISIVFYYTPLVFYSVYNFLKTK